MEIIATTNGGVLISATKNEVNEILSAVHGAKPEELKIGMKIPAIDYASTIRKIQILATNYRFVELCKEFDRFDKEFTALKETVLQASKLTID